MTGHFKKVCRLRKRATGKLRRQNAVDVSDVVSNDGAYEESYDIDVLSIDTVKAHEVLGEVMFHMRRPDVIRDKVDTGVMVTCMPLSMLRDTGLDEKDLAPTISRWRGVAGTDMKTSGKLTA